MSFLKIDDQEICDVRKLIDDVVELGLQTQQERRSAAAAEVENQRPVAAQVLQQLDLCLAVKGY